MFILGVCSCPAGIAHTYMAAKALKKAAEKLGYEIKVETQGAAGPENIITAEDIERAAGVIFAADVAVINEERFDELPILEASVTEAIKDPKGLIEELLEGVE
jgi:fructose-specific phosphotransferase system IIB component